MELCNSLETLSAWGFPMPISRTGTTRKILSRHCLFLLPSKHDYLPLHLFPFLLLFCSQYSVDWAHASTTVFLCARRVCSLHSLLRLELQHEQCWRDHQAWPHNRISIFVEVQFAWRSVWILRFLLATDSSQNVSGQKWLAIWAGKT